MTRVEAHTTTDELTRSTGKPHTTEILGEVNMRNSGLANLEILFSATVVLGIALVTVAAAHEGHKMECSETSINAMNADIQLMDDGEAKKAAVKEMNLAQDMLASKNMTSCKEHMDNAMEAMER